MYSLILHGRRLVELQKCCKLRVSVQNAFAFSNSFSCASAAADVCVQGGRKGKAFTVSYLVESLGFTTKLAESISRRVSFEGKGNPDSVLNLFRRYGFTNSQISTIVTDYPQVLIADAERSLGPNLQFLQSRGASTSELTDILTKAPKILGKKEDRTISSYYDFVKEIVGADKSSEHINLCHSLPQGSKQDNIIRNVLVLRELGMPQKLLFSLLIPHYHNMCCGKEKFEESLIKVVEMGFDPTSSKFILAMRVLYGINDKIIEERVDVFCKRLGFAVGDVWEIFKKHPICLTYTEKKILKTMETFLGLGFSRDEFTKMVKCFPQFIGYSSELVKEKIEFVVKQMNWPVKAVSLFPQVISYSMEKRIVPRCNVMKALMSKGLLGEEGIELPTLPSVLACTDEVFLSRYVRKPDDKEHVAELMVIYTK